MARAGVPALSGSTTLARGRRGKTEVSPAVGAAVGVAAVAVAAVDSVTVVDLVAVAAAVSEAVAAAGVVREVAAVVGSVAAVEADRTFRGRRSLSRAGSETQQPHMVSTEGYF